MSIPLELVEAIFEQMQHHQSGLNRLNDSLETNNQLMRELIEEVKYNSVIVQHIKSVMPRG